MIEFFIIMVAWAVIAQMWQKPEQPQQVVHHHYYGDIIEDYVPEGPDGGEELDEDIEEELEEEPDNVVPLRRVV